MKTSKRTLINIKKVSLIFFIITGLLHIGSSALITNSLFLKEATIINTIMDAPFIISGLLYGFSSLRLELTQPDSDHKILDIILICVIVIALIAVILVNTIIPDL